MAIRNFRESKLYIGKVIGIKSGFKPK